MLDTKLFGRPTWIEIDLDAITHNIQEFRQILGNDISIVACIKAHGYGHGLVPIAKHLVELGIEILAVGNISEGILLRKSGISCSILVFGNTLPEAARLFSKYNLSPTFFTSSDPEQYLRVLGPTVSLKIWVKVETGLGRLGISSEEALDVVKKIYYQTPYQIEGLYTHLGGGVGQKDKTHAESQWRSFKGLVDRLSGLKINIPHLQVANSAAIIDLPHTWLNTVSIGHGLYGVLQTEDPKYTVNLRHAFRALRSKLISVKKFPVGSDLVGVKLKRDSFIGVSPIGCGDGFSCKNLNGEVLIKGMRAQILGKISLEHLRIDVTDIPDVSVGDEVTLYGPQDNEEITLEEMCKRLEVPPTEVLTSIHPSAITYVYIKDGKIFDIQLPFAS